MASDPLSIIRRHAPSFGLDPSAVVAYALTQGGVHWGAVGDKGTSFGPFQLHRGGALGKHNAAWANSPQGLIAAMGMMSRAGARGMTGPDAAAHIVGPSFGRGANPASDMAKARAAYSRAAALVGGGGSSSAPDEQSQPPFSRGNAPTPAGGGVDPILQRRMLGQALMQMFGRKDRSITPFLGDVSAIDSQQQAGPAPLSPPVAAPAPQAVSPVASGAASEGLQPGLTGLANQFGLNVTSGYRSAQRQAQLYAGRSADGTVAKPGQSFHNSGRAIDVSPNKASLAFLKYAFAHPEQFVEVFYDPAGKYIKHGKIIKGSIGGHSDHVHIAQ